NGQPGQVLSLFEAGQHHRLDDAVNVFLSELSEDGGGGSGLGDQGFQVGNPLWAEALRRRSVAMRRRGFSCNHCGLLAVLRGAFAASTDPLAIKRTEESVCVEPSLAAPGSSSRVLCEKT